MGPMGDGKKSAESSSVQPMESTRVAPPTPQGDSVSQRGLDQQTQTKANSSGNTLQPLSVSELQEDPIPSSLASNGSLNSTLVKEGSRAKTEFSDLNGKLQSFMSRAKRNEALLKQAEAVRKGLEQQLNDIRQDQGRQVDLLRSELDTNVKKAVLAEEQLREVSKAFASSQEEIKCLKSQVAELRATEQALQRLIIDERSAAALSRQESARAASREQHHAAELQSLREQLKAAKVETATLQGRVKLTNLELTAYERKADEAERTLQFTADAMLTSKLAEQRSQLEAGYQRKMEKLRQKYDADAAMLEKKFEKRLADKLRTYVSAEKFAELQSQSEVNLRRALAAESQLAVNEEKLRSAKALNEELQASKDAELAHERKRRERLNRRLMGQTKAHREIQEELDVYKRLIESLDILSTSEDMATAASPPAEEESAMKTPVAKRIRKSAEPGSPSTRMSAGAAAVHLLSNSPLLNRSSVGPMSPAVREAQKLLIQRALTPRKRRVTQSVDDSAIDERRGDCRMM